MKGRPGAGKDVTRIELHAKFSSGEMEVNFLNNVFALGYHHPGRWSPLIRIPIILNRRTNEKLSIIYLVTGSEHKTKKASMISCHKRLRQLCFYPSFFTAFPQTGDLFLLCLGLSHTEKTFSCKEIGKNCFVLMLKNFTFLGTRGWSKALFPLCLIDFSSLKHNSSDESFCLLCA